LQPTLSFITLPTPDLEGAVDFYAALGWTPARRGGGYVFFQLNGLLLALLSEARWAVELGEAREGAATPTDAARLPPRVLLSHNAESYEQLVDLVERWAAAGGAVRRPLQPTPWGGARALVADPGGLSWELVWNPQAHRDAQGGLWLSGPPSGGAA